MKKKLNIAFCLFFLLTITGFGLYGISKIQTNNPDWLKNRGEDPPKKVFSEAFDRQFSENPKYIRPLSEARLALFHKAITQKVIPGKDDWLFLGQEDDRINTVSQSLGLQLMSPREIKHWRLLFDQRQTWCDARGIEFNVFIAPNKASVYKEMLPGRFNTFYTTTMTTLLFNAMQGTSVDGLHAYLNPIHNPGQTYFKNDTHWNDRGAWRAANGILHELRRDTLLSNPLSAFTVRDTVKKSGDLARMMMKETLEEQIEVFEFNGINLYQQQPEKAATLPEYLSPEVTTAPKGNLPKTMFFHDSFGEMLKPFLSPHFEEIQYFRTWKGFEPYWIDREQPEIVLNLIVERILMSHNTHNDPLIMQWYWPSRFESLHLLEGEPGTSTFKDLSKNIQTIGGFEDEILVLRLTVDSPSAGKISLDYGFQQLGYELKAGKNQLYVQAVPGQPLEFSFPEELKVTISSVDWCYF